MYSINYGNLHRQSKALELLQGLLDEEYLLLENREVDAIISLEFSIHELLRQVAAERMELKKNLNSISVLDYSSMLSCEEEQLAIAGLYYSIDNLEQICAQKAARNTELSLALYDQGQELLEFLHKKISAEENTSNTYGPSTKYQKKQRPEAALIMGKL